ncbi:MAG: hypothetical protein GXP53_13105 [Deltaproteobacteria bacterium]|nr:hypothetical protein [Deltaproteobacteria bacterium]
MEITCKNCNKKIVVPDEKLPEGKAVSIRCPGCKSKISIDMKEKWDAGGFVEMSSGKPDEGVIPGLDSGYDSEDKPFDFLEEEGKTAMICESDTGLVKKIKNVLEIMDYHVTAAENLRSALRSMKYHLYDLILIDESFDGSHPDSNGILIYLERLNMTIRRNIYVGLLTKRYKTMDNMAAFLKSVNVTINPKDIGSLDRILSRGISEKDLFYAVYRESMKKTGRI